MPFANVTDSVVLEGEPVAPEVAPVTVVVPENRLWSPVVLLVPKSPNLSCWKYSKLNVESYSTTLPTAPVLA